jgi:hypothetical protein
VTMTQVLSATQVRQFVADWYKMLDVHAAPEDVLAALSDREFEMRVPEATMHSREEFKGWYEKVTRIFFDEVHTLRELNVDVSDSGAEVQLVVHWQAKKWDPPKANSDIIDMDAAQRWTVKADPTSGEPRVTLYIVDSLTPLPGSISL